MKKRIAICAAAGILLAAVLAGQAADPANPIQYVFILSVDGLMPESYVHPAAHGLKIPTLEEMVQHGAYSEGAQPVMPTVTYPAHTTMATGTNPGTHGIVTNTAWDPLNKNMGGWRWYTEDIRVPTLWDAAHARGLRTALVQWPVTVGARADLRAPEYWRADIPEDLKLLRALATRGLLNDVARNFPDFYSWFTPPAVRDRGVADIACYAIATERPNLMLVHMAEVDHWEHERGPFSPEADAAIENADAQIARLIEAAKKAGIWEHTAVVVVSDHGFAPVTKSFHPGVLLVRKKLVTLDVKGHIADWKATVIVNGGSAYLYLKDPKDAATAKRVRELFVPRAGKRGSGIGRAIGHEEIVAMGGDPEAYLALEAAPGYSMAFGYTGDLIGASKVAGTHGYFPDQPEMRASFLAYSPAIAAGKLEGVRLLDVAPTVARWLNLDLPQAQGKPLPIALRTAAE